MKIAMISEDKALLQQMHALLAASEHEIVTVPGKAGDPDAVARELLPDLMLLDARNKDAFDLERTDRLTLHHPAMAVILLSAADSPEWLLAAMRAGVREVL